VPAATNEERTNAKRRASLMLEIARLFRRRGYHGSAMSDIGEHVGLNKGTLYYYFPSKADMLYAIYEEAYERLDANIAGVPKDLPPEEELVAYLKAIMRTVGAIPDVIAVYFQEHPWLETALTEEQAQIVRAKEAEFTDGLRAIIKRGVRVNAFRRVNDQLLAVQLMGMISSLHRWHLAESEASAELVTDMIISYLYEGILPQR
jgi:TetR/AcrR family transcriptional regulator, cholesterol catabolism regulator